MKISPRLQSVGVQTVAAITAVSLGLGMSMGSAIAQSKPTISVPAFKNETNWWWWGSNTPRELGDALSNELSATGSFQVVERQKLDAVLSEQELAELGLVRQETAAPTGQLTGAQYVILGRVTSYEEGVEEESSGGRIGGINIGGISLGGGGGKASQKAYVAIDLRVVDTTTGEVVHSRTVEGMAESKAQNVDGGIGIFGIGLGGGNAKKKQVPVGKALRAALIESTDYLSCVMVKQDSCVAQYGAKDTRRRNNTRSVLQLD